MNPNATYQEVEVEVVEVGVEVVEIGVGPA